MYILKNQKASLKLLFILLSSFTAIFGFIAGGNKIADNNNDFFYQSDMKPDSGILYDRVVGISGIERYTGHEDHIVTPSIFRQIYFEIYQAADERSSLPPISEIREVAKVFKKNRIYPIAIMDFRYHRMDLPDHDNKDLRLHPDGSSTNTPPYALSEERLFVATTLYDYSYRGNSVRFVLDESMIFSNMESFDRYEIDFADNKGFLPYNVGDYIDVHYRSTGKKTIIVRAVRDDEVLESKFCFDILELDIPDPSDTLHITASIPYNGEYGSGDGYVYYAEGHSEIIKPVIVVEGFDMDNEMDWDELYDLLDQEYLIDSLRSYGFDAIVLNFDDSPDYIQRNACILVELIEYINNYCYCEEDPVVIGASMGGLVSRYALTLIENLGYIHNVRTWISFDSPQKGANIPLGIQYWMDFFADMSEEAEHLRSRLSTPAAKQMLLYFFTDPPSLIPDCDPLRYDFLDDLIAIGNFPQQPRTVAIINGSGTMESQGFGAGEQIILYEYSSFLVDIVGNIWAIPDSDYTMIMQGEIDKIWPLDDSYSNIFVMNTLPYDNAPGGYRETMTQMDTTETGYGDIVALYTKHCFIPAISSLALDVEDPFYDINGEDDIYSITPFDQVYFPIENQDHVSISPESARWFMNEINPEIFGIEELSVMKRYNLDIMPNPFSNTTNIRADIIGNSGCDVNLYDLNGRLIRDFGYFYDNISIIWNGRDNRNMICPPGIYLCTVNDGQKIESSKIIYMNESGKRWTK